jgi:hypothetical protein
MKQQIKPNIFGPSSIKLTGKKSNVANLVAHVSIRKKVCMLFGFEGERVPELMRVQG